MSFWKQSVSSLSYPDLPLQSMSEMKGNKVFKVNFCRQCGLGNKGETKRGIDLGAYGSYSAKPSWTTEIGARRSYT